MLKLRLVCIGLVVALASGCVKHIRPYKPKIRNYKPDKYSTAKRIGSEGSLWSDSSTTLFSLRRSHRIGDLVTVVVEEAADATRDAKTSLARSSEVNVGISALAGLMSAVKAAHPSVDPAKLLSAVTKNDFEGQGKTERSGSLRATITSRIKRILPNGDYYVEGHKVVMVNEEESHLYISGVVRPADIEADNTVKSGLIADAQVEYTGRGPIADKQKPGWFSRFLDWVNPF